ncbi:MAG: hypothetical protein ACK4RN_08985 [Pseudorhodobacter sp.]
MDETALALNRSVMRWHRIANLSSLSDEALDGECPLCLLFLDGKCVGCPIADMTGQTGCRGTNHSAAMRAFKQAVGARLLFPDYEAEAMENFQQQARVYAREIEAAREAWLKRKGRP